MVFTSVDVTEAACDRLKQSFSVGHIIVAIEGTLGSHVTQSQDRTIVGNSTQFLGSLYHLVERHGRNIQCLAQHIVIQIVVRTFLTHVGRHSDGVKYKVNRSAQHFHGALEHVLQIFYAGSVGRDYLTMQLLGQGRYFAHADSYRSVRQRNGCTLFNSFFCNLPGNGLLVQSTENNAFFSFQ